jgi:hypothetical protein
MDTDASAPSSSAAAAAASSNPFGSSTAPNSIPFVFSTPSTSAAALVASPAPAAAPRSASSSLSAACWWQRGGRDPTVEYHDRFLGKVLVIPVTVNGVEQRHQLEAPLIFVNAWLSFSRRRGRRSALGTALPQPPPPVDHTQIALWPAQRVRGMPELTATACHRLSTAPASLNVYFRVASGWRALILDRVVSGYMNKIRVRLLL